MSIDDLRFAIESGNARLGIAGLGYVGLPLACILAESGFYVTGVDSNPIRVSSIKSGGSPIAQNEPGLADLLAATRAAGRLDATGDYSELTDVEVWFICVDTPVDPHDHLPRFESLRAACTAIGKVMKEGALVIVESTLAPGTMDGVVRPELARASNRESGGGFYLGHCPERVMPGRLLKNMRTMSRVVGGETPSVAEVMKALYSRFVGGELDLVDCVTAEIVKTAENAYRDVNIAFANELAKICEVVGCDVWRVRELVNKSPGRNVLLPGGGVGGHCIPKDPWLLAAPVVGSGESLLAAARAVNDGMPLHVAGLLRSLLSEAGVKLESARVTVLGFTYLEDSDDTRNSPSQALVDHLIDAGCEVTVHDPYVEDFQGDALEKMDDADGVILMVAHTAYKSLDLKRVASSMRNPVLVDARACFDPLALDAAGFRYRLIGAGRPPKSAPNEVSRAAWAARTQSRTPTA